MRVNNSKKMNNASPQNILYELMLYTEWIQETDVVHFLLKTNGKNASSNYYIWRPWDYVKRSESLLEEVAILQNSLLSWQFAVGEVESVLAVLQDSLLEIRTPRDDFSSVVGKAAVMRDSYPQWRRLCWSPDCSVLAVASSQGSVNFYDLLGSSLFSIPPVGNGLESQAWVPEQSLAGMFFINTRVKNQKWPFELILVDYGGNLRSYYVSPSEGYLEFHSFSFGKGGVSSVNWDTAHNLVIVTSVPAKNHIDLKKEPLGWGISMWRLLNDYPYYRLSTPSPEDLARAEAGHGIVSWISSFYTSHTFSVVFKTAVSPDAQHVACIHTCGSVSIWLLPSLRLQGLWSLKDQPNFSFQPENTNENSQNELEDFFPVDISWWAQEKVIIARKNGAVSVCEINNLCNMLGETPEFVHGEPKLSPISTQKGVLVLERETSPSQDNESDEENESLMWKSSALVKSAIYWITDLERFQPKRKKPKMQQWTFRLLGIKSTTPDELFSRKIDAGEFDEALHLAEVYNLDTDRVYQSQWRNSPVSENSISAYLSKISKKLWVFEECLERVPDTLPAAKRLLEFGLKVTSFEEFLELASEDDFKILEDRDKEEKSVINGKDILSICVEKLSEHQKCLIRTRRSLLHFSDQLFTYEKIINSSEEAYSREQYQKFRQRPLPLSAIELARQADYRAVGLLLTHQGREVLPYWLTILSNFPETTNPASYKHLLPECSGEGEVFPWEESEIREVDWCENKHFDALETYEEATEYNLPQRDESLTPELLSEWYRNRIYELELLSNMVDHPLELAKLAKERNIKGLDGLSNELVTLDVLVYDVGMEDISLRDLEIMSPLQKAQSLMYQSNEDNFVENMRHRLVPYLQRCEKLQSLARKTLLSQFLTEVSSKDLKCPLKMFEFCAAEPWNSIVQNTEELTTLALDAIYAYPSTDQLDIAESILKILPLYSMGPGAAALNNKVAEAHDELKVAVILKNRGHDFSPLYLHNNRHNLDTAKALFQDLSTATGNKKPAAVVADWDQLLQDLLEMQNKVFTCIPLDFCYEVYASGVLASNNTTVIRTAVRSLCCHSEEKDRKPLSLQRSVELVLMAAVQYFDSAESLTDTNINLAKACLSLITEDNPDIQEEKDLIAALQLLSEFKIALLPMQVRLCTDRMRLIESCLASRATAYKDYHKLLSLAHKLRICGNDSRKREGTILVRVANISFQVGDYDHCAEICQELVDRRHGLGWEAAQRLGQCADYWDLSVKRKLIAFALIHCPDTKINELLETRCELEYRRLQLFIREHTSSAENLSEDEDFVDAVTTPQTPSKEFLPQLSSTILNTSKMITQLTNAGFWKEKLLNKDSAKEVAKKGDFRMRDQGFHEFYSTLHGRCHQSVLSSTYGEGERVEWQQYQLIQALLQASLLEQEKLPRQLLRDIDKVLIQFAGLVLPEDSCLGLVSLLALANPRNSDQCFSTLPHTLLTLQLAVYLFALLIALKHNQPIFFWTPDQVLGWVMSKSDNSPEYQLLTKALTQLHNFEQSKQVEQLNAGVDVRRFAWDTQYKVDSILGLAMCEEWGKLQAALDLGASHGVDGWEIVFSHIRILLLSNSPLLAQRLSDNRLTQLLKDHATTVVSRLQEVVLPSLSGVSYNQLISYYTVLNTVAPESQVNGLLPRDHIKLIKKVKATSPDIDYVRLVSKPSEVLEVLRPALRKDTIGIVSKLLKEMLKALPSLQSSVSVSILYTEWALMQFKSECLSSTCRSPLEQFDGLTTYFQKMTGAELFSFVKRSIFCHQAIVRLDVATRITMLEAVLKFCQQHFSSNDNPDVLKVHNLRDYIQQVWAMEGACASCKTLRNYLLRLDEACGDCEAISTIVQTAILDASVPSYVLQQMAKLSNKKTLSHYVTDLLHSLPSHPSLLTTVLERVEDCLAQGEKIDSWSILIGPISEKDHLPAAVRKTAAQISKRLGANYNEELEALRLKTEAVLRTPVQLSQISDHNSRYLLFKQSLSEADSWDSLHTLSLLLFIWPDVYTSWFLELIEAMAEVPNNEMFQTLQKIFRKITFEEEEIEHLVSRIEGCDALFRISVCLIPDYKSLHLNGIELLRKMTSETILPAGIAKRIVELGLTPKLVATPILSALRKTLLDHSPELCEQASDQLISANYLVEAQSFTASQ